MAGQTSYSQTGQGAPLAGVKGDAGYDDVLTGVSAEASAEMPFGIMLVQGTNPDDCKIPSGPGDVMKGVLLHSHAYSKGSTGELGDTGLKPKARLNVLNKGRVWVPVEEAVAAGDRAYVRYADDGSGTTTLGAFRKSFVAGQTLDATSVAVFKSATTGAGIALVEVDMVNAQ